MEDLLLMRNVVLISDPRVTSIPVEDNGDALADVRGVLAVDARLADPEGAYAHLRHGLLVRLEDAQRRLPGGYHLVVVEGYRPPALQRRYFDAYRDELRVTFPDMSPEELVRCIDFRYITDALTPDEALAILERNAATRAEREAELRDDLGCQRLDDPLALGEPAALDLGEGAGKELPGVAVHYARPFPAKDRSTLGNSWMRSSKGSFSKRMKSTTVPLPPFRITS